MKVGYGIITLNQFDWIIDKHLPSVDYSLVELVHVHVSEVEKTLFHGGLVGKDWLRIAAQYIPDRKRILSDSSHNTGVAPGWNRLCKTAFGHGCDAIIIANDDIILEPDTLKKTIEALEIADIVACPGHNLFSYFGMTKKMYADVGEFDENFWPAYYEDNDYAHRMKKRGYEVHTLPEASFYHKGSATIKNYDQKQTDAHHFNFRKNTMYYTQKWGGLPGYEQFDRPFLPLPETTP